jgi:GNAT superfamily N-acetyltransferase
MTHPASDIPVQVLHLADFPECLPTLARWFKETWGEYYHDRSTESIGDDFRVRMNCDALPIALVAVEGDQPRGTVALAAESITTHPHLTPWLCALYVHHDHRHRGIGSALLRMGMEEARRLGFAEVYAGTAPGRNMLERLGWETLEMQPYHGEEIAIMRYSFGSGVQG